MGRYLKLIFKRVLESILTLVLLLTLIFILVRLIPGGPFDPDLIIQQKVTENLRHQFGLDQSLFIQYKIFVSHLLQGDLGVSFIQTDQNVIDLILQKLMMTLRFAGLALFCSLLISFALSLFYFSFVSYQKYIDLAILAMLSLPTVLAAPFLIYIFSIQFKIFPAFFSNTVLSYFLPVFILSLRPIASLSRIMIESLQQSTHLDYVKTVHAYGFSKKNILFKWIFKNTFISWLTYLAPLVTSLFSGSLLVEKIFSIPGLGSFYIDSLFLRDYSSLVGITFYFGAIVVASYLIVDVAIIILDQRIKKI